MRQHNGVLTVTEPAAIDQISIDGAGGKLSDLSGVVPAGDLGNQILQITLRSTNVAWEWRFGNSGAFFWMAPGDVIILPLRDRPHLLTFEVRRAAGEVGNADLRVVYEV